MKAELAEYWTRRGRRYYREFRRKSAPEKSRYDRQVAESQRALTTMAPLGSILELACGFGRMTAVLRRTFPAAYILASDLSPSQIKKAGKLVKGVDFRVADATLLDLDRTFDLVVACEFYMHLPDDDFTLVMDNVSKWSRRFAANVDYTGTGRLLPTESGLVYQFRHDYVEAYHQRAFPIVRQYPLPNQTIFVAERGAAE